jgi:hypothetical protein
MEGLMKKIALFFLMVFAVFVLSISCKKNSSPAASGPADNFTRTATATPENTGTATFTKTATFTLTITPTCTVSRTFTASPTITPTFTATLNATAVVFQNNGTYSGCNNVEITTSSLTGDTTLPYFELGSRGGHNFRLLLHFDLSSLPVSSVVKGASLTLNLSTFSTDSNTFKAYNVTRSYIYNQASWVSATTSVLWTAQGGDFNATPISDTIATPSSIIPLIFHLDPVTVQSWVTNPSANYGILLKGDFDASSGHYWEISVDSDSNTSIADRPKLTVYYQ